MYRGLDEELGGHDDGNGRGHGPPGRSCEVCGRAASVWTLVGYVQGRPDLHCRCMGCADERDVPEARRSGGRAVLADFLVFSGIMVATAAAFGDFADRAHEGFGWVQRVGIATGSLLLLLSALLRIDLGGLVGLCVLIVMLCWDTFGGFSTPGFGWRQQLAFVAALYLGALGMLLRCRDSAASRRESAARAGSPGRGAGSLTSAAVN